MSLDGSKELSRYPAAAAVLEELGRQMPFLLRATSEARGVPLSARLDRLEFVSAHLREVAAPGEDWAKNAVRGYVLLCLEHLQLQRKLEATGRYLLENEAQAWERVYSNPEVIQSYYLPGLFLSAALWPNHHLLLEAFQDDFLPGIPEGGEVLEVGVGTGLHLATLLQHNPGARYTGLDISPYSLEFAGGLLSRLPGAHRVDLRKGTLGSWLRQGGGQAQHLIMGEVLEHVERPDLLLGELRQAAAPGAMLFLTTAIYAASLDHLYLFDNAEEVRHMLAATGWTLEREWVLPLVPGTDPEASRQPMNYGAVLRADR